jgi:hypothetical protein
LAHPRKVPQDNPIFKGHGALLRNALEGIAFVCNQPFSRGIILTH